MKKRVTKEEIRRVMQWLGRRKTLKKTLAVRKNGRLGGRPKNNVK